VPRISIIDRYILRESLVPFLMAFGVVTTVLFLGTGFKLMTRVKGVDMVTILEVAPFIIPYIIDQVLPVAILVGTVTGYARLASDREIWAMKLTGITSKRLLTPTIFLGLLLASISMLSSNYFGPMARNELASFVRRAVFRLISQLGESRNGIEYEGPKHQWKVHWKGVKNGKLDDIIIYKIPHAGQNDRLRNAEIIHAKSGTFRLDPYDNLIKFELEGLLGYFDLATDEEGGRATLTPESGDVSDELVRSDRERKLGFRGRSFAITINLDANEDEPDVLRQTKNRDINNLMALHARDIQGIRKVSRPAIHVEIGRRVNQSLAALTFAILGAVIGLIFRGVNRIVAYVAGFVIALVVFYPLSRVGELIGESGALPPILSLQLGNIGILLVSAFLFRRASR
jgi:lipopolysaccharide export LptBFGC system permease protein LptF